MKVSVFLKGLDRSTSGRNDWQVRFEFNTQSTSNEIVVSVPALTNEDEVVKVARSKLHDVFTAAVEQTKEWKIPV